MSKVGAQEIDGIESVFGSLYRVRFDIIQLSERQNTKEAEFFNPRRILMKNGKSIPDGFSREEMNATKENIRTRGLMHPLTCRWVDGGIALTDGERRYSCIDVLRSENADCYNKDTGTNAPAMEVYEYVLCNIQEMDIYEAFSISINNNEQGIPLGEAVNVALVKQFREWEWTDEQILKVTQKQPKWLKDTDAMLATIDEETFKAFTKGDINRRCALNLSSVADPAERLAQLGSLLDSAQARLSSKQAKVKKDLEKAKQNKEIAEATEELLRDEGATDEEIAEAQEKTEKASKRVSNRQITHERVSQAKPKATGKDLKNITGDEVRPPQPLTPKKVEKQWLSEIQQLVHDKCEDTEGNPIEIDLEDAKLAKSICEAFLKGEADLVRVLKRHYKAKQKRLANA